MRNLSILFFTSFLILSCTKKEKAFDSLEYSYAGTFSEVYSLKFTDSDTVYVYQEWIGRNFDDSISQPKEKTQYYGIINPEEKSKLCNYIEKVNLFKYKSEYYEDFADGSDYALSIKKDNKNKMIFVRSLNAPKELDSIAEWINKLKKNLTLKKTKKHLVYETAKSAFVKPPPPPPIQNKKN